MRFFVFRKFLIFLALVVIFVGSSASAQDTNRTVGTLFGEHEGYTLFTPQSYEAYFLIDDQGRIINQWNIDNVGRDARLRENGNLVTTMRRSDQSPDQFLDEIPQLSWSNSEGGFAEYTWDGDLVWEYEFDLPNYRIHHGLELMPNGNILFVAWEYITREEALANGRDPDVTNESFWPDAVFEYDPQQDAIVWEWHAWDHIIQDFDPEMANYGDVAANPQLIDVNFTDVDTPNADWMHVNAVDYHPELDQILLNVIFLNEIWIIDHSITTEEAAGPAGDLLYRWGNPQAYRMGDQSDVQFGFGHDAQWIPAGYPGEGNIMMYSNRHILTRDGEPTGDQHSMIIEFTPPLQEDGTYARAEDSAYGPDAPVWTYSGLPDEPFFSPIISGTQRLSNGNTLIIPGVTGSMLEVTTEGERVWRYVVPINDDFLVPQGGRSGVSVFRARRYTADFPGFADKDMTPGLTIEELASTSSDTPARLNHGENAPGTFSPMQASAYYTFNPAFAQAVTIAVDTLQSDFSPTVQLLNTDLELIAEGDGRIENYRFLDEDRYIIQINHNEGNDFESDYRIEITETDNPFAAVDDDVPLLFYGTALTDSITEEDNTSTYSFWGEAGDRVSLRATRLNGNLNPSMILSSADGDILATVTNANDAVEALIENFEVTEDSAYLITVTHRQEEEPTYGVFEFEILDDTSLEDAN